MFGIFPEDVWYVVVLHATLRLGGGGIVFHAGRNCIDRYVLIRIPQRLLSGILLYTRNIDHGRLAVRVAIRRSTTPIAKQGTLHPASERPKLLDLSLIHI